MRHRKAGKQLSRNSSHRRALLRNMVTSLLKHEQIETTDAKAKSIRPVTEKMISLAKRNDLHARRRALAYIQEKAVTHKLFDELKDRYLDKQGGYVRIIKKGARKGDGAPISIVQLTSEADEKGPAKKKPKRKKAAATAPATRKPAPSETEKAPSAAKPAEPVDDAAVETHVDSDSEQTAPQTQGMVNEGEASTEETRDDPSGSNEPDINTEEKDKP